MRLKNIYDIKKKKNNKILILLVQIFIFNMIFNIKRIYFYIIILHY